MAYDNLVIRTASHLRGEVSVPGDKSISHRAVILGSLSQGRILVRGMSSGEDNRRTMKILGQLGVAIRKRNKTDYIIQGCGLHGLREPSSILYAGNSGTTMRLMLGVLSGQRFFSVLSGDASLNARPMKRVVEPLRLMGACITGRDDGNLAPLAINGTRLHAIHYQLPIASAQVKSALLLAGFYAEGTTVVHEPLASRDHTERMLRYLGAPLHIANGAMRISSGTMQGDRIEIPGDISSAAFLIVAGLLVGNAEVLVRNVGINPTRTGFLDILRKMGAAVEILHQREMSGEPVADIAVRTSRLTGVEIGGSLIPRAIDEIPILAIAAARAEGTTVIRDAQELRVKESDRIATLCTELKKFGVAVEEREDGMVISGREVLSGAVCNSHGDHRIAMAMVIAGLCARGETIVEDCACIKTSFPEFMDCLTSLMR